MKEDLKCKDIYRYESMMNYSEWVEKIPFIKFPKDWLIKPIPSFGGAMVRFQAKKGDVIVSVYLDCYDSLGLVGSPYWEVYEVDGDTYRCLMNETDKLLMAIKKGLNPKTP